LSSGLSRFADREPIRIVARCRAHRFTDKRPAPTGGAVVILSAAVEGRLARTGDVRLVFSKRPRSAVKTVVAFAVNEAKLAGRAIVSVCEKRWAIEVLFKELRGDLGLGDYQVLSKDAIQRHLLLAPLVWSLRTSWKVSGSERR